jgi:flagellar hook assembly protein FlgD
LGFQVAGTQRIKLQILNKDKKVVRVLIDEIKPTGHFTIVWDLRDNNGNRVKDGFYRAQFFLNEVLKCHGDIQISS